MMSGLAFWLVLGECCIQGMLGTLSVLWFSQQLQNQEASAFHFALWGGIGTMGRAVSGQTQLAP